MSDGEWQEQMEFLGIKIPDTLLLTVISLQPGYEGRLSGSTVTEELYKMTMEKIMRDLVGEYSPVYVL